MLITPFLPPRVSRLTGSTGSNVIHHDGREVRLVGENDGVHG
jgi:hypothetical protein